MLLCVERKKGGRAQVINKNPVLTRKGDSEGRAPGGGIQGDVSAGTSATGPASLGSDVFQAWLWIDPGW